MTPTDQIEALLGYYGEVRLTPCQAEPGYFYEAVNGAIVLVSKTVVLEPISMTSEEFALLTEEKLDAITENPEHEVDAIVGCIVKEGDRSVMSYAVAKDLPPCPSFRYEEDGTPSIMKHSLEFFIYKLKRRVNIAELIELGILGGE